eukprot:3708406-Alexandrium_andersonii.AAC.1
MKPLPALGSLVASRCSSRGFMYDDGSFALGSWWVLLGGPFRYGGSSAGLLRRASVVAICRGCFARGSGAKWLLRPEG